MGGNSSRPEEGGAGGREEETFTSGEYPPSVQNLLKRIRTKYQNIGYLSESEIEKMVEDDKTVILKSLSTLDGLENVIQMLYSDRKGRGGEEKATKSVGDLPPGFGVEGFERMNASANNYDCLIHSFLTATSPNFRLLNQTSKDEFANFFRRTIFLGLPLVACSIQAKSGNTRVEKQEKKNIVDTIQSAKGYLQDNIIFLLAAQFHVNILTATSDKRVYLFNYHTADSLRDLGLIPKDCKFPRKFERTISIYTSGDHFEALRHTDYRYNLPEKFVKGILLLNQQSQNQRRPQSQEERNLAAAIAASLLEGSAVPSRPLSEEERNLEEALKASLSEASAAPQMTNEQIAKELGMSLEELQGLNIKAIRRAFEQEGGGTRRKKQKNRRTRRQKRYLNLFK
jgi:hypothetical protein